MLGVDDPPAALLDDLDRPLPFPEIVEPFADTADGLARLHDDGWRIAIVADTSPQMVEVYRELGLDQIIETFVISGEWASASQIRGCSGPRATGWAWSPPSAPSSTTTPSNLDGALALGYSACGMARYGEPPVDRRTWVRDLDELLVHLAELRDRRSESPPPI